MSVAVRFLPVVFSSARKVIEALSLDCWVSQPSPSGLFPFGVGGGGGMFYPSQAYMGGKGGKGAVIVELVLD